MMRFLRTTFGLIFSLLVLLGSFLYFCVFVATKSHPKMSGVEHAAGLQDSLAIYRNQYGVPHIIGKSDADVFFGIGYAHAQDRLWQMDIARRAGRGRLSEIFGKVTLRYDMFLRCLGIQRTAAQLMNSVSKDSRMALEAYARGVNAYIKQNTTKLPFEFDALTYKPEPWTAEDCLITARMMAWEMNMAFWSDAAFGEIAERLGAERALQLIPSYPDNAPMVVETTKGMIYDSVAASAKPIVSKPSSIRSSSGKPAPAKTPAARPATKPAKRVTELPGMMEEWLHLQQDVRTFLSMNGSANGSNCWVMKKNRKGTSSGVILANDPHLTLTAPPRWYQAHLTSPSMNAVGLTIPGLPFVISGRNDYIAWGITNMMLDDCDYFIEKIDSSNKRKYILPSGASKAFKLVRDTIRIKDSSDAIIDFRYTERSAVISDVHPYSNPILTLKDSSGHNPNAYQQKYCLTFTWTGAMMSDETLAMYRLNKARNWEQFQRAVNGFCVPGLNFTYADVNGNMGIAPAGSVPRRGEGNPNLPQPGWDARSQWQGLYPPSTLPRTYNPASGFVASANNKTARNLPYFVSSLWEPASRAVRINELLSVYDDYSSTEAGFMQTDLTSPYARDMMGSILPVLLARQTWMDSVEKNAFEMLKKWDFVMESTESMPSLYTVFLEHLVSNTFEDELGHTLFLEYSYISNIPTRKIAELLKDSTSVWFDDVKTSKVETREDIIFRSYRQSIEWLKKYYHTTNAKAWTYGKMHELTIPHLLGSQKPLDKVVNLGPFPIGGDNTTINNAEWHYSELYKPVLGPSMRLVCDMQDSVIYTILPGGNSGQPLSAHYANQMQLWLNGGFTSIPVKRMPAASFTNLLLLLPE